LSDQVNAPFYGAYFGALAAAGGDHIVESDDGTDPYAQYIIYREGRPLKLVFINTDYYSGSGSRSKTTFTAIGLKNGNVKAVRMTAPSSETMIPLEQTDASLEPSIGGVFNIPDRSAEGFSENYLLTFLSQVKPFPMKTAGFAGPGRWKH
jgi:hypothetical protein